MIYCHMTHPLSHDILCHMTQHLSHDLLCHMTHPLSHDLLCHMTHPLSHLSLSLPLLLFELCWQVAALVWSDHWTSRACWALICHASSSLLTLAAWHLSPRCQSRWSLQWRLYLYQMTGSLREFLTVSNFYYHFKVIWVLVDKVGKFYYYHAIEDV